MVWKKVYSNSTVDERMLQWGVTLCSYALSFILPAWPMVVGVMIVVTADQITGIVASQDKMHSKGLRKGLKKMFQYFFGIIVAKVLDDLFIPIDAYPILYTIGGAICFTEAWSVYENISKSTGTDLNGVFRKFAKRFVDRKHLKK